MLKSIENILGFTMGATDGDIGKVKDFYIDDKTWRIRYLVVETGTWLFGRKVLLSPAAVQSPDNEEKVLPVNLTKDQIRHSPDIDTEKPVSRQLEEELHRHYSWPVDPGAGIGFMTTGMVGGVIAPDVPFEERIAEEFRHHEKDTMSDREPDPEYQPQHTGDPNLISFKDVKNYKIHANGTEIGNVEDFLIDSSWNVPFLVAKTGEWHSGKKIPIATSQVSHIEWKNSSIYIDQATETLGTLPELDYDQLSNAEYNQKLFNS